MGQFDVTIKLGNAEMQTREDVAEALEQVAKRLRNGRNDGVVRDLNGNNVGAFAGEGFQEGE